MKVGIVGLGYVGLPLGVAFAEAGNEVVGVDVYRVMVERDCARAGAMSRTFPTRPVCWAWLRATTDFAELTSCQAVIVCAPTPLTRTREPDLTYLVEAAASVAGVLQPGQLVVLESTQPHPGTTRERLQPLLEESGMKAGSDFHLAFSPERIDPGRTDHTSCSTPKVVGGLTEDCAERARELYGLICNEGW